MQKVHPAAKIDRVSLPHMWVHGLHHAGLVDAIKNEGHGPPLAPLCPVGQFVVLGHTRRSPGENRRNRAQPQTETIGVQRVHDAYVYSELQEEKKKRNDTWFMCTSSEAVQYLICGRTSTQLWEHVEYVHCIQQQAVSWPISGAVYNKDHANTFPRKTPGIPSNIALESERVSELKTLGRDHGD